VTAPAISLSTEAHALDERWFAWVATVDHKRVGILYVWTALFFFLVGGCEALLVRLQLAVPRSHLLSPEAYNQIFTMHGTTMIFLVVMPVLTGFANYLVPLMIGARDVAFPRLNAMAYWLFPLGGFVLHFSLLAGGAPNVGWFSYAPLSEVPFTGIAHGADYWAMSLLILGVSTITAAINLIATILSLRAPGMTMRRVPLFVWMVFVNSILTIFALPALTASCVLLLADRLLGAQLFLPSAGGSAILWQHYFWSFGHPEVYIMALPAFGMISEVIPVFSRKPIFGYAFVAASTVAIAVLSFGVWAHHMFTVGLGRVPDAIFAASSMLIAVPTGVKIFNWVATMWGGSIRLKTAMLFAVAFLLQFVLGGLSGITFAVAPIDWQMTDTYYVVAHFHYVLFGGTAFAVMAAIYYWFPKMTGRLLDERLGRAHFWLMVLGFNLTFFVQHLLGLLGMPRRVYTYPDLPHWAALNMASTVGAFILGLSALVLVANVLWSLGAGAVAGDNPWSAWTLEWSTASPPPAHNFEYVPPVRDRRPLWDLAHPEAPDDPVGPDERPVPTPERSEGADRREPEVQRLAPPRVAVIALIASEAVFFVLLIVAYVFNTATSRGGPSPENSLDAVRTGLFTIVLLASSLTFWRAERAHTAGRRSRSLVWLGLTVALGLGFLAGQASEYARMFQTGIVFETNLFTATFFTLTGFHGIHVMAGVLALAILFVLSARGALSGRMGEGIRAVGYYWHFVDVVWIAVFTIVYVRGTL
jgi:cytochrome c oxidase subunit I